MSGKYLSAMGDVNPLPEVYGDVVVKRQYKKLPGQK